MIPFNNSDVTILLLKGFLTYGIQEPFESGNFISVTFKTKGKNLWLTPIRFLVYFLNYQRNARKTKDAIAPKANPVAAPHPNPP